MHNLKTMQAAFFTLNPTNRIRGGRARSLKRIRKCAS